jgi:alkylation response protein AidB-like acyl-CoA dehydrogenase
VAVRSTALREIDRIAGMGTNDLLAVIDELAPRFAERDATDSETFPSANVGDLKAAGVLYAPLPAALGGRGSSLVDAVRAVEAVAAASPSTALLLAMPLGLAGVYALGPETAPVEHRAAWGAQIEAVAADYRAGMWYAACNSEKGAGGSLANTKTVAERGADGTFRLTGEKILASSGRFGDVFFSTAKTLPEDIPGCGVVEFFFLRTDAPGVQIMSDWDGFGMRSTESHTVRFDKAVARDVMGFPNFIESVQPLEYWFCLFAAIPLGCVASMLRALGYPAPSSPAVRLRLADAQMRIEALRAYLLETSAGWRAAAGPAYKARVLRTKTYVTQESTKLCAELFALGGGRHYVRDGALSRALAASFAGTALRPPLPLALDALVEQFSAIT